MLTRGRWPITSQPVFEPPLDRSVRLFWPSFLIIHPQTLKLPAEDIMLITLIHQGDHEMSIHSSDVREESLTHGEILNLEMVKLESRRIYQKIKEVANSTCAISLLRIRIRILRKINIEGADKIDLR